MTPSKRDHLDWRVRLFAVGAGLGLGGLFLDSAWLIWAALAVLCGGLFLRFLRKAGDSVEDADEV